MSQINPFLGSILQAPQVQERAALDKDRQVRRATDQAKDSSLTEDQLDHQVENSEELTPIHQDQRHERRFKRSKHQEHEREKEPGENDGEHLDLTA